MSTSTNYTIVNRGAKNYTIGTFSIKAGATVSVEHLDSALIAAIDSEADLTVSPAYAESWADAFDKTAYNFANLSVNIAAVTAYPDINTTPAIATTNTAVAALARNLDAVVTSLTTLQGVVGLVRDQVNDLQKKVNHTYVVPTP